MLNVASKQPRYTVGIDLGTTHTVVAFAERGAAQIQLFPIAQLVAAGEVAALPLLASVRFHPAASTLAPADLQLPWPSTETAVLGRFALELGAQQPGRLVASAKSWLSHAAVDRTAPILPWGAPDDIAKVSPLAASASTLAHVRAAWNAQHPKAPLEQQELVLTVPASFDEGARALTLEAARLAGLPGVRLIEEPQAAFYDWVYSHRETLAEDLQNTRRVLVCDVGGGTTDLTLIDVDIVDGQPRLTRSGVGDHLVLGGDNMDLALAHLVESRLGSERLSATQLAQLTQRCRAAKELLWSPGAPDSTTVTLLGSGSRLIGGARSAPLSRADLQQLLVDGFFPQVAADALPQRARSGLVAFGLPYASDAAITRHIAAFLQRHPGAPPDTLLLNGGVFHAQDLVQRLQQTLDGWAAQPLQLLHNPQLDAAVARGAVAYALARAGKAPRIGGGSARSYFLVLDDGLTSQRGICVLPHGAEEGRAITLADRTFALRLGRPVRFYLASSVTDTRHQPGELIDLSTGNFVRLPPIATVVQGSASEVLVQLSTALTEVGTLEMHCVAVADPTQRWQLEFQLRGQASEDVPEASVEAAPHPRLADASNAIGRVYGDRSQGVDAKEVKQLRSQLERLLGSRDSWDTPLLRTLFGQLLDAAKRRRRTAQHERQWFNLTGYALRPGFGHPLDDWRVQQLWQLFEPGIAHSHEPQQWSEWWTLWRRVAGGLTAEQQDMVFEAIAYYLQPGGGQDVPAPGGPPMLALDEMLRMAASFERLAVTHKVQLGQWLVQRLQQPGENPQSWWALGRIGARQPLYASLHHVVPPDVAAQWLEAVLAQDWAQVEPAAFAATQIARATGDRARDVPEALRQRVLDRLAAARAAPAWIAMVREVTVLDAADARRAFGESLPVGLKLVS
ncbi:Hsp70 protein [Rhodoferax sp. OV413]|uniref:Hsp70 family protein n=1 Tax=Rhodoferax sp. OV413 TaxID=1855285 RepID=UPI0008848E3D|nr:Hsp70 family protein [Rhodoferax sp. OV413]SDP67912.1 Hsp70 protein [Rhodoferax sp. OV413]